VSLFFRDGPSAGAPFPAGMRFLIAAVWAFIVFRGSGFVYDLLPRHELLPGVLYRIIGCTLMAAGFAFFMRVLDGSSAPPLLALGLPLDLTAARQWLVGSALGAAFMTCIVLCIAVVGGLRFHLHLSTAMFLRAGAVVVLMLGGALMEELAFRGYPFQKLTESLGALGAVLVLSALFGAVHLQNPESSGWLSWGFFNTIAVGIIFALVRIRTASLLFPFGLHFGWNFFQGAVFGLPVSGLEEFSTVVRATVHGAPALTGGTYGPEASATCALVLVIALPITWVFTSKQKIQHRPPLHRSAAGI
jgi:membrane protease YdiL (CAAX protease family)